MRYIFFVTLAVFIFSAKCSFGQTNVHAEEKYKSALNDYKQGKYAAAMEKLSPLTSINATSPYAAYAHYYYALSAFQLKRFKESKQMLLQLQSRVPGWNKISDVHYLLGAIAFENGQIKEGMDYLARIRDSSFAKDVQALKQHHLSSLNDLAKLKELQKQYSSDRDIALILINFIENSPSSTQTDHQIADQLEKQYKITRKEKASVSEEAPKRSIPKTESRWTKGYFDISVLLPFRLEEFSSSKRRSNQFAYDYYLGLTLAQEQLREEGITVNLWAYDVSNDSKSMKSIVENKNFQSSDMVIGPLYSGTFDVTAEFTSDAGVIMLNPLSTDGNLLKSADIYLAHPSISFQMQKAAEWMKGQSAGLSAVIYYGNTAKDSAMAFSYAEEWKNNGGKVMELSKIQGEREWLESKLPTFEGAKPGHVALFSSEDGVGVSLIEVLNGRKLTSVPMIAAATSFNMQQTRLAKYGSRLFLIETDYVDREKESIRQFQKSYWNKTSSFPSVYSYQGFDQLLFFGRMMAKYKDKLSTGLQSKKYGDGEYLLSGFDYTKSNDNQIIPVLKYNGSKWLPIDR